MIVFIVVISWAACTVFNYWSIRRDFINDGIRWDRGTKIIVLTLSCTGPFGVIVSLFLLALSLDLDWFRKDAKW